MDIVEMDAMKCIGMECHTDMEDKDVDLPKLWESFLARIDEIKDMVDHDVSYGICVNGDGESFTYTACVEVKEIDVIPDGMVSIDVDVAKYAVYIHKGKIENVGKTYDAIKVDAAVDAPWLERYDKRFTNDENSEMGIYVPLR